MKKAQIYSRYRLSTGLSFYRDVIDSLLSAPFKGKKQKLVRFLSREYEGRGVVLTSQARIALFLYLKEIINKGDEVLVCSYNLSDVINMIICAGGKPVFVDVNKNDVHMSVNDLEKKKTDKSRVVIMTHLYGMSAQAQEISDFCKKHKLKLIEDCAQSYGVRRDSKLVGTFGDAAIVSFGSLKNVNGLFGGALIVRDYQVYKNILRKPWGMKSISALKLFKKYLFCLSYDLLTHPFIYSIFSRSIMSKFDEIGHVDKNAVKRTFLNPKEICTMGNFQANLIFKRLKNLDLDIGKSNQIVAIYQKILDKKDNRNDRNTYLQYPILCDDNQKLKLFLKTKNIDVNIDFFRNCAEMNCFSDYHNDCLEVSEMISKLVLLPSYPRMSLSYVENVANSIREFSTFYLIQPTGEEQVEELADPLLMPRPKKALRRYLSERKALARP